MTINGNEQALKDYLKICRTEERETFVLDGDYNVVYTNEPAKRYGELAPDYFTGLLGDKKEKLANILNRDRYYVDEQLVGDRIALIYRIDIPTRLPFYELSLWEKHPAAQSKASSIELLSAYAGALNQGEGCSQQILALFQREGFLFAAQQALLNGTYNDQSRIDFKDTICNLILKIQKIAAMRGVLLEAKGLYFAKTYVVPVCVAHLFLYTFAALLHHSVPGDRIKFDAASNEQIFFKFALIRHNHLEQCPRIAGRDLETMKQIAQYLGGNLEKEEDTKHVALDITIPASQFPTDSDGSHFELEQELLPAVSPCVSIPKIRTYTLKDDLSLTWSVFPREIYHDGTVAACVQTIQERLNRLDYRDLYGNHVAFNLTGLTKFNSYLADHQERLAGIHKIKSIYNAPQKVPKETYEKIADVYGLTAENLSAPNFILNLMAGRNLADEKMICPNRSGAGLLVFDGLQSNGPCFQTDNRAFNTCRQSLNADTDDIALWFDRGMEIIQKEYFDQSIPIGQKIGNNLTVLRLAGRLTLDEAAAAADLSLDKLKALEQGVTEDIYCRDLDRLCQVYQTHTPPGLFINGYALILLWRRNFMEYGVPATLYKKHPDLVHDMQHNSDSVQVYEKKDHAEQDYASFLESYSLPVVFLDEGQRPIRKNAAARERRLGIKKEDDPILDIFHSRMILWVAGKEIVLSPGNPSYPKIYLFELNRFGRFRLTMAVHDMDGSVNPADVAEAAGL